jgi:pimeloyl-ACP methyl ester carboxylesterase
VIAFQEMVGVIRLYVAAHFPDLPAMTRRHWYGVGGFVLSVMTAGCRAARVPQDRVALRSCQLPGIVEPLRCAEVRVPEVRGAAATRTLRLRVVVVPALRPSPTNDPWVELVGGPGNAATDFARQFVEELAYIRETHDVLLVDQRGTGGSNPLYCEELALHQVSSLPPRFPTAAVDACRARLTAHAALDHFTTVDAAEDLDAVRQALGYETLNLFGSSYGTRVVLEYLRRYSPHVRSAMLWGVVSPEFQRPLWYPRDGQAAFDRLVAECAQEGTCRRAFPAITIELRQLLARLDTTPVPITLTDPGTQREFATTITSAGVAQAIWSSLAEPDRARQLPLVIHAAAEGNYGPLRTLDVATRPPRRRYYNGMHLSVVCGEEVLQSSDAQIVDASRGSFMNAERGLEYRAACVRWRVPRAESATTAPVVSRAPTLIVSGAMDPITPRATRLRRRSEPALRVRSWPPNRTRC